MSAEPSDWLALKRMRAEFIEAQGPTGVYWKSEADLEQYHRFFGARIGWKWDAAIEQARQSGWQPRCNRLIDWGCGSGIATLRLLAAYGPNQFESIQLWDHSRLACSFAQRTLLDAYPGLCVTIADLEANPPNDDALCVASHVLNELNPHDRAALTACFRQASQIFWVEPGSYDCSRLLGEQRESLRDAFQTLAPCVCPIPCPMFSEENARHWCHFFAKAPIEAFTSSEWSHFATIMEIDLRSLPYSFLAMTSKRSLPDSFPTNNHSRIIGRPRQYKGYTRVLSCDQNGLNEYELQKRENPSLWRSLKKGKAGSLYQWDRLDDQRIRSGEAIAFSEGESK